MLAVHPRENVSDFGAECQTVADSASDHRRIPTVQTTSQSLLMGSLICWEKYIAWPDGAHQKGTPLWPGTEYQ